MEGGGTLSQDYVRGAIYRDLFSARGIDVYYMGHHYAPLGWLLNSSSRLGQKFLSSFEYQVIRKALDEVGMRINRWRIVHNSRHFDVVVFVKVSSFDLIRQVRQNSKARLVYDLSDALWLPLHARVYPHIREILRSVDAVTWGYKYDLEFARQFNSAVFHWPAASQVELFDAQRRMSKPSRNNGQIVLGWVGSVGTAFSLYVIWEALERLFRKHSNLHLRLLGVGHDPWMLPHFECVSYSVLPYYTPSQMIDEVLKMDIGLFPLFDVEDSRVRGFLKALVYMSGEAAVVASPRGQVVDLIRDGVDGMLANSTAEWIDKLELLITDHALRKRIAVAGLETARRDFSLEKSFECLLRALGIEKS